MTSKILLFYNLLNTYFQITKIFESHKEEVCFCNFERGTCKNMTVKVIALYLPHLQIGCLIFGT